jgi:hypothetical protein
MFRDKQGCIPYKDPEKYDDILEPRRFFHSVPDTGTGLQTNLLPTLQFSFGSSPIFFLSASLYNREEKKFFCFFFFFKKKGFSVFK